MRTQGLTVADLKPAELVRKKKARRRSFSSDNSFKGGGVDLGLHDSDSFKALTDIINSSDVARDASPGSVLANVTVAVPTGERYGPQFTQVSPI